jgi:hypothetical protein
MSSDLLDILKIGITVIIAAIGWLIGHYFSRLQKRRDLSLEYLINAYRVIADEISQRPETKEANKKLEAIITDIQLFGSPEQVEMAQKLAHAVASGGEFQLNQLINSLRHDLRKQIGLKPVSDSVTWLRFKDQLKS